MIWYNKSILGIIIPSDLIGLAVSDTLILTEVSMLRFHHSVNVTIVLGNSVQNSNFTGIYIRSQGNWYQAGF